MRTIAATAIKSSWVSINPRHKDKNFELFGLDFMIDEHFKPWLIEVNTNPCLEMSSPVLERIIPYMV
jgi:tubulin polyglutamylase TTLL1